MTKEEIDTLSLRLFGENVNPAPSLEWFMKATDEEIINWQSRDKEKEELLESRVRVRKEIEKFTFDKVKELDGTVQYLPNREEDVQKMRELDISEFTFCKLKKMSKGYQTNCIFHNDHNPSCMIYPGKGYHCFSCGANGNAIDWCMQEFGLNFQQATEYLLRFIN